MTATQTERLVVLDKSAKTFLKTLANAYLSPRSYYRILKVARTIADLGKSEKVTAAHLAEAFSYRMREER